jgi:hypothetical protein
MKRMIYTKDYRDIVTTTGMTQDQLWKYISFDDWDYCLIVSGRIQKNDGMFDSEGYGFLRGCCYNKWKYIAKINMTIGIAYHS